SAGEGEVRVDLRGHVVPPHGYEVVDLDRELGTGRRFGEGKRATSLQSATGAVIAGEAREHEPPPVRIDPHVQRPNDGSRGNVLVSAAGQRDEAGELRLGDGATDPEIDFGRSREPLVV